MACLFCVSVEGGDVLGVLAIRYRNHHFNSKHEHTTRSVNRSKMASSAQLKDRIIDGIYYVVDGSKSNCLLKGVMSGVAGYLMVAGSRIRTGHGSVPRSLLRSV